MATCINDNGLVSGWYAPSGIVNGVSYTYQIGGSFNYPASNSGVLNYANYGAIHSINGGTSTLTAAGKSGPAAAGSTTAVRWSAPITTERTSGVHLNGSASAQVPLPAGYQLGVTGDNNDVAISAGGVIVCMANIDSSGFRDLRGGLLHHHGRRMAHCDGDHHPDEYRRQLHRRLECRDAVHRQHGRDRRSGWIDERASEQQPHRHDHQRRSGACLRASRPAALRSALAIRS